MELLEEPDIFHICLLFLCESPLLVFFDHLSKYIFLINVYMFLIPLEIQLCSYFKELGWHQQTNWKTTLFKELFSVYEKFRESITIENSVSNGVEQYK